MPAAIPLATFLGPDGDRYVLFPSDARAATKGEPVEPGLAAWLVRNHAAPVPMRGVLPDIGDPEELADELEHGPTSRFVLRKRPRPQLPIVFDVDAGTTDLSELAPPETPDPAPQVVSFELRLVDEMGEPVAGISIDMMVDGAVRSLTTDSDGRVRVDDGTTSFASAKIVDIGQLRDTLRPRWEAIREGDWIDEALHHSYIDCREPLPSISLESKTLHTVVVQPRVVCARLVGMFFDTSKCFLLPSALADIRSIRALYEDRPDADVLIVGHTDTTGQPSYNDPLSIERADSVRAYLRDDVDAWLEFYGASISWEKRWGSREDNLMLTAILVDEGQPVTDTPMRHFQSTRGLSVDGIAGPQTRRQLVTEYMGFDGTTLPGGIEPVSHGCGENFPVGEGGELDEAAAEGEEDIEDRRVELFFFDGQLGVLPTPSGQNSAAGSPEYPEWRRRARETHDFETGAHRLAAVRVCDDEREPIPGAPCRYVATGLTAIADDEGFIELDEGIAGEVCDIEWTKPGQEHVDPWPFARRVFVQFPPGDVGSRRKLHNVGYLISDDLEANVLAYEVDFDFEPSGELDEIEPSLHAWHDGGTQPDPNAPPPPPPDDDDPTKEKNRGQKKATTAPQRTSTKLLVSVDEKGVSKSKPLSKALVSVDVVIVASGKKLEPSKVLTGKRGALIFQFLDVPEGTVDITARRKTPDGDLAAIETRAGFAIGLKKAHEAVNMVLGKPAATAFVTDKGKAFGFDDFTQNLRPRVTVEKGKTDVVRVAIEPKGTFAQCTFETSNGHCTVSPKRANKNNTTLTFKGVSKGETEIKVMRDGSAIGQFVVKTMVRKTKRVAVRLVHEKKFKTKDVSDKAIKKTLNEIYDQAMITWKVTRLPEKTVAFDLDGDGTMNTQGFGNPEQKKVINECKDDSFDFNLFIVSRPDDGKTGGHMGFNQRYGFVFSDVSTNPPRTSAHELGHGQGLEHVDQMSGKITGDTENLLFSTSAHGGTQLRHFQWNKLE